MTRLFVLGNASIDVTLRVPALPRAGETLMAHGVVRSPGGKGLNQAVMAARAGACVHFCAPLGREPETALVLDALQAEGFASLALIEAEQPTDLSTLLVADGGENVIISTGDCADAVTPEIAADFVAAMRPEDWLLIQGNLSEAATYAGCLGARRIIFNTAPIRWISQRILQRATVVIANEGEAERIAVSADPAGLGGRIGIVTLGARGCVVAEGGGMRAFPAQAVASVDTTGAGDIFCGVLAAGLVGGAALDQAIGRAQRAAAIGVARAGCFPSFPSRAELAALG